MGEIVKKTKRFINECGDVVEREVFTTKDSNGEEIEVNELGFTYNQVWVKIQKEYFKALERMQNKPKTFEEFIKQSI